MVDLPSFHHELNTLSTKTATKTVSIGIETTDSMSELYKVPRLSSDSAAFPKIPLYICSAC